MPWPAYIVAKSSRLLDTEPVKNKFYGLYDSILNECFPTTHFMITPHYATPGAQSEGSAAIEFVITFVVESMDLESPVFFFEIEAPTYLPSISARKNAEKQVRKRIEQLANLVQIPKLYGVSAMGRQLSYYTYEKATRRKIGRAHV